MQYRIKLDLADTAGETMKTDFRSIVMSLMSRGFTEQSLVKALAELGVVCSQPTINRLKNGTIKKPSYELGLCLVKLYEESRAAFIETLRQENQYDWHPVKREEKNKILIAHSWIYNKNSKNRLQKSKRR